MSSRLCAESSRRALYRVFVRPAQPVPCTAVSHRVTWQAPPIALSYQCATLTRTSRPKKPAAESASEVVARSERNFDPRYTTAKDVERMGRSRLPQDHEITDPDILVIDDDGTLEGPLATRFVMTKIQEHESLRMSRPYVPATKDKPAELAICKIVNKKADFERQKLAKEKKSNSSKLKGKNKELEINWAIGDHDLETKFKQLRKFLDGPNKVHIQFGKKKGSKTKTSDQDARILVTKVRDEILNNMPAKEFKPPEGEIGAKYALYMAGKSAP